MAALSSEQEAKSRVPPDQAFRNMLFTEDNVQLMLSELLQDESLTQRIHEDCTSAPEMVRLAQQ